MKRWILALVAMLVLAISGAINAQQCPVPNTLPTAPSAQAQSASFNVTLYPALDSSFSAILWREPCPSNAATSIIYLRATPTRGTPWLCFDPANDAIIQNGVQFSNVFSLVGLFSFCSQVHTPTTVAIAPIAPPFLIRIRPSHLSTRPLPLAPSRYRCPPAAQVVRQDRSRPRPASGGRQIESGTGYAIDYRHEFIVLTIYSYQAGGSPQWYLASGAVSGNVFTATLDKYVAGQCISCTYRPPTPVGNDGAITITFTSSTTATVNLPGGRVTHIQLFDF